MIRRQHDSPFLFNMFSTLERTHATRDETRIARDRVFLREIATIMSWRVSEESQREFEAGDKSVLLPTLHLFLCLDMIPPDDGLRSDPESWNCIFGRPKRLFVEEALQAQAEGDKLYADGYKIDDLLWDALAKRLSSATGKPMSAGTAKNRYYAFQKAHPDHVAAFDQFLAGDVMDDLSKQHLRFILTQLAPTVLFLKKGGRDLEKKNNET